ncbi:MAG: flagellar hook-length control protein FliK [Lachnospiraceae bacterium]|nr:flagellar hook-length control protein FliK [Lachnospiraceae bacterium]
MRLTELFIGNKQATDAGNIRPVSNAQILQINRQIRALAPGQTINGEVLSKNGNDVQIRLAEDLLINARVDGGMNLEIGKSILFEVRNNGSALTLSPLFSNMATDTNVLKALDMSGLPINNTTVAMTESMMEAGLPVDKNSLQQVFREINTFTEAELYDVVDLHRLKLPVTEENLQQVAAYKNLTHQLTEGMGEVVTSLSETIQNMVSQGKVREAASLYLELLNLVTGDAGAEGALNVTEIMSALSAEADSAMPEAQMFLPKENLQAPQELQINTLTQANVEQLVITNPQGLLQDANVQPARVLQNTGSEELVQEVIQDGQQGVQQQVSLGTQPIVQEGEQALFEVLQTISPENAKQAEMFLKQAISKALLQGDEALLKSILGEKEVQKFLADKLQEQWLITPEEVADEGKVEELYNRLNRQLKGIANALETAGQVESTSYRATTNLSNNIDFLHQVNQMYTYVQLPLKLQQGQAHGDLYVYTNKKNLAAKDGQISALLHLDMEHLGPVDVYVAMNASKVNTKFYVKDDEMLDFLEEHMDLLTARLNKRGYDLKLDMQVRNQGDDTKSGIRPLMEQQGNVPLVQYAFDMRA